MCAVERELQLDKLSCKSIVLGEGVKAQDSLSCTDSTFLLGIPGCTTEDITLFTVKVQATNSGSATVDVTGIDVIGEGMPLPFDSTGGVYNITAVAATPPAVPTVPVAPTNTKNDEVIKPAPTCTCDDWGEWQWRLQNDCGRGGCDSAQVLQTRERECDPVSCEIEVENRCVADAYCASMVPVVDDEDLSQTAATGETGPIPGWLIAGLILLIMIGVIVYFSKKKKQQ
ncbi:MAG: hypothetical protein KAR24_02910 [Candidatus Pacebacteria bacterium]|nr:hypothetical protein [Candidatus Paceibacterota bacterium]